MEKQRKYKLLVIVALMCSVVALTIGFATFNRFLKISSEAKVSVPEDIKLTLYGVGATGVDIDNLSFADLNSIASTQYSYVFSAVDRVTSGDYKAQFSFDDNGIDIKVDNLLLSHNGLYGFYFLLHNESDFDVYIHLDETFKENTISCHYTGIIWLPKGELSPNGVAETVDRCGNQISADSSDVVCSGKVVSVLSEMDEVSNQNPNGKNVLEEFFEGDYAIPAGGYLKFVYGAGTTNEILPIEDTKVAFKDLKLNYDIAPPSSDQYPKYSCSNVGASLILE